MSKWRWIYLIVWWKTDLKNATRVNTSWFTQNVDLASWQSEVNKLDIGKFETNSVDLSKLGYVVKNEVVKTTVDGEFAKNSQCYSDYLY